MLRMHRLLTDLFINKKIIIVIRGVHNVQNPQLYHYIKDWYMYTTLWKTFGNLVNNSQWSFELIAQLFTNFLNLISQ